MTSGILFDIRRFSIHDGPGIRTAVFFKGCPLECRWCHNPEGVSFAPELLFRRSRCILCGDCLPVCPTGSLRREQDEILVDRASCLQSGECVTACPAQALEIAGREVSVQQVLEEVERDRTFFEQSGGGVTFTGGEPLAQPAFLGGLLGACRAAGLHSTLDTSGYAPWPVLDGLRDLVDLFLYDLKLVDPARHAEWTGAANTEILDNLRRLSEAGHALRVRIPVIPGANDDDDNLQAAGRFLSGLPNPPPVELLAYHALAAAKEAALGLAPRMPSLEAPSGARLQQVAARLAAHGLQVMA